MNLRFLVVLCVYLFSCQAMAAGFGNPDGDVAPRFLEISLRQEIPPNHPRLASTREQLQRVAKVSGEEVQSVAQLCMRNARYAFDAARIDIRPHEVLEAVAAQVQPDQPLSEYTQRYLGLRMKDKLDHAGAMARLAAGRK